MGGGARDDVHLSPFAPWGKRRKSGARFDAEVYFFYDKEMVWKRFDLYISANGVVLIPGTLHWRSVDSIVRYSNRLYRSVYSKAAYYCTVEGYHVGPGTSVRKAAGVGASHPARKAQGVGATHTDMRIPLPIDAKDDELRKCPCCNVTILGGWTECPVQGCSAIFEFAEAHAPSSVHAAIMSVAGSSEPSVVRAARKAAFKLHE